MFGVEKLEWCGYPMLKNFDRVHERISSHGRKQDTDPRAMSYEVWQLLLLSCNVL